MYKYFWKFQILGYSWINSSEIMLFNWFISLVISFIFFLFSSHFLDRNRHGLRTARIGSHCRGTNNIFLSFCLNPLKMGIFCRRFFSRWLPKEWPGGIAWWRTWKPWKPSAPRRPSARTKRAHWRRTAWPWLTSGLTTKLKPWIPVNRKRVQAFKP